MLIPLLAVLLAGPGQVAAACSGAEPAILQAAVRAVTPNGDLKHYVVAVTVANQGSAAQPGTTLQSIEVLQDGQKVDQKGVPPLHPGQAAVVTYAFDRSRLAREGSTDLDFRLVEHDGVRRTSACALPTGGKHLRV